LKDQILQSSEDFWNSKGVADFIFVDDLERIYSSPNDIGKNTDSYSALPPFADKNPYECSIILRRLSEKEGCSGVEYDTFAIVDARSLVDGTMLLVGEPEEEDLGESSSVRITFELLGSHLSLWGAGHTTPLEDKERAVETIDGVLRTEA
jgi:hypothetical protein